jgi:hypothetical protein
MNNHGSEESQMFQVVPIKDFTFTRPENMVKRPVLLMSSFEKEE